MAIYTMDRLSGSGSVPRDNIEVKGDSATVGMLFDRIVSQEDALLKAGLDPKEWEINEWKITEWDVTMKIDDAPTTSVNYYVSCKAKRRVLPPITKALADFEDIVDTVRKAPVRKGRPRLPSKNGHLLVIGLFDHHVGMLAWERETGENWDVGIAKRAFVSACEQMLAKTSGYPIKKILFPIGNDFFHVNDDSKQTPRGKNTLDVDGRICKLYRAGIESLLEAVQMCADVAEVEIVWVPGNHDPDTSFYAVMLLHHAFAGDKRVTVDIDTPDAFQPRKYRRFGNTLIGLTHGDGEKQTALPILMATERPDEFGAVTCREWLTGHRHKAREERMVAGNVQGNCTVRICPSLAPPDGWHFRNGYVGGERWAEAYLYGEEEGFTGMFTAWAEKKSNERTV